MLAELLLFADIPMDLSCWLTSVLQWSNAVAFPSLYRLWGQASLAGDATSIIFVATNHVFCRDESMLAATKLLSRQTQFCRDKTRVCRDKSFVMTSIRVCRDKSKLVAAKQLSWQNSLPRQIFVATKVVLRQKYVCRDKRRVLSRQMILVAAPANDTEVYHNTQWDRSLHRCSVPCRNPTLATFVFALHCGPRWTVANKALTAPPPPPNPTTPPPLPPVPPPLPTAHPNPP